jgi:hypothetical protein
LAGDGFDQHCVVNHQNIPKHLISCNSCGFRDARIPEKVPFVSKAFQRFSAAPRSMDAAWSSLDAGRKRREARDENELRSRIRFAYAGIVDSNAWEKIFDPADRDWTSIRAALATPNRGIHY